MINNVLQIIGMVILGVAAIWLIRLLRSYAKSHRVKYKKRRDFAKKVDLALKKHRLNKNLRVGTWTGFRDFIVMNKVQEAGNVCSYYLKPCDEEVIPSYLPGQYLTFAFNIPGKPEPVTRCYSLSDTPLHDYYRISVKRILPTSTRPTVTPGLVSNFLYENLNVGDTIQAKAPSGSFTLDPFEPNPVVMVAGGIGITPLLSMLNTVYETGVTKTVYFIYAVMNTEDHIMKKHLAYIAAKCPNIHLHVFYASPLPHDEPGSDFQHLGYVTLDKLKQVLPSNNFKFYLCGPPPMLTKLYESLISWGVPLHDICSEAFGPASIQQFNTVSEDFDVSHQINYLVTDYQAHWEGKYPNLLEFSESHGINLTSGCRSGRCGVCMIKLKCGAVNYITPPQVELPSGNCLPCIAVPMESLDLEA